MGKSSRSAEVKSTSWSVRLGLLSMALVLGGTLVIFPTTLNPGLPILAGGALAILWSLFRIFRGAGPYYHWGMDLAAGLLFWMAVCAWQGLDKYLALRSFTTFIGAVAFLWIPQCAIKTSKDWRFAAHLYVFLSTVTCLLAWPKAISIALESGSLPPLMGQFVNPDTFSIIGLLALTLGMGLFEKTKGLWGVALCIELGILFITIVATGCRASLLGFGVGSLAFLVLLLKNRSASHLRKTQSLLAVPLVLALLSIPLINFGFQVFGKYASTLTSEAIARETTRHEVITRGWSAIADSPLLGSGPGCFGLSFQSVRLPGHDNLYINIAHNDPMEMAVELGVPGGLLWLALLYAGLNKTYRLLLTSRSPVAAAGTFAAVLAVTIYSLFNFVINERPVLWAEMFVLGLALSLPSSRLVYEEPKPARYLTSLGLLALGFFSCNYGYQSLRADSLRAQSQLYAQQLQIERAMEALDQAIALQPNRTNLRLERAHLEDSWSAFYPGHDGLPARLGHLEAARRASPRNLGVLTQLSEALVAKGDITEARKVLAEAQEYAPYHATVREKRAALAIQEGALSEALTLIFEDPQSEKRDRRLVSLLISLELKAPGSGVKALTPILDSGKGQEALAVLEGATQACLSRKLNEPGLRLSKLEAIYRPDDYCSSARRAAFAGAAKGPLEEWTILSESLGKAKPTRDECYAGMVTRWATLGPELGKTSEVEKRLQNDLESDSRVVAARVALSQLMDSKAQSKEAIALLRQGLDKDPRSVALLRQLGELYQKTGSKDLALTYFQEAAKAAPTDSTLKAKVVELQKSF